MALKPGHVLQGRYHIQEILGQGGFGAVYRAVHQDLQKDLAVKEATQSDAPRLIERFQQEARILAHLDHPSLPKVTDHFHEEHTAFLVMDFVPGQPLGAYVQTVAESGLDWDAALQVIKPVFDALSYLHAQTPPVIHRDVKPANIRVTPEGKVYLVDFGIARAVNPDDPTSTMSRAISSGYSPYEQYSRSMSTDVRSDLYAVGATLYYMLCGVPPCDALDRLGMVEDPLQPIGQLNDTVPDWGEAIVHQLMAVKPENRYASVADVMRVLFPSSVQDRGTQNIVSVRDTAPAHESSEHVSQTPHVPPPMDVFWLRDSLIADYQSYIQSFMRIRDSAIRARVEQALHDGLLYPDPLIQLNPSFEPGAWIDDLVKDRTLHPECARIFRKDKGTPDPLSTGEPLRLHRHQMEAIHIARAGQNYVLTTGTGSGKSLSYIVPIVDHVLRHGSGRGVQAIIVYPMNALANSQYGELEKFLLRGFPESAHPLVTFRRYTGQESAQEKQEVIQQPPDILLTNFVMLELILTRPSESQLIAAAQGVRFLVLDELHTYRGRQGADVALLVRRTRERLAPEFLQCVGTSATLAGKGSYDEQRAEVARVATQLFGATVEPAHVIGETLKRMTPNRSMQDPQFRAELTRRLNDPQATSPQDFVGFINDPLSIWIETTFGVKNDPTSGRLVRSTPTSLTGDHGAAHQLHSDTGVPEERCVAALKAGLLASYTCEPNIQTRFPPFAFRLHQFISRGDTVYATLQPEADRYITLQGQRFRPGNREQLLLPLTFCRECGQEYYSIRKHYDPETQLHSFVPRDMGDEWGNDDSEIGFLFCSSDHPFPTDEAEQIEQLPEDWLETYRDSRRVKRDRKKYLPESFLVGPDGVQTRDAEKGLACWYIPGQFRFCLQCGVSYNPRQRSDFARLTTLGSEGRSTATTILSLATIRHLHRTTLPQEAQKLLSFTDNRQDASLQAGHLNDFVEIGLLRSALYSAVVVAGASGIRHEVLPQHVFDALDLPLEAYTGQADLRFQKLSEAQRALRDVLGYRLYRDLRRGWRITSPNLEQCGLLTIGYASLDEVCAADDVWQECHPALATAHPDTRKKVANVLLDYMRRELAIRVDYLDQRYQERIQQQSSQYLVAPWALDEDEQMDHAAILFPRSAEKGRDYGGNIYLSAYSAFGQYVRRRSTFGDYESVLSRDESGEIIRQLLGCLAEGGLVEVVTSGSSQRGNTRRRGRRNADHTADDATAPDVGYQLPASVLIWQEGDGSEALHDPIRVPNKPDQGGGTNPFFVDFYKTTAAMFLGVQAREHTAQVPYEEREERESQFRAGDLPILYCSPTMELGIDIAQLNVVNMRNVPPTPANYAQRSGRAGRSGQPALVFSYCSIQSSHDQYFFRRPDMMVSGNVAPPRLDLANEDLVRSHIYAIWLAETGISLGDSLKHVLDVAGEPPPLTVLADVQQQISSPHARQRARQRSEAVLATIHNDVANTDWYDAEWLDGVLDDCVQAFDSTCKRWRELYITALAQASAQDRIIRDASRSAEDKKQANRLRREAEEQLKLLTEVRSISQSDFYSYRYFASEGFLPGYSFPRLPLSAYIPARRGRDKTDDFLSRPRFLAISEFGPRAFVYHEGSRYEINRVILPVGNNDVLTRSILLCPACGYLHLPDIGGDLSYCKRCTAKLDVPLPNLFRMENVVTRRRDRISSDEEERMRFGYEIISALRFENQHDIPTRTATVLLQGSPLAHLSYGQPATLWRINMGLARRKDKALCGFELDVERGYWRKNEQQRQQDSDHAVDPASAQIERVIPYVEDRRNCLLFELAMPLSFVAADVPPGQRQVSFDGRAQAMGMMASLQAALKNAIQIIYQLEENELAAEPLPSRFDRRLLLFYESSEGGAGVLRRLLDDPNALPMVARKALELCHFDPDTGADEYRAPLAREDCEAACYDCLMSYTNQHDHSILDRHAIRDVLLQLAQTTVVVDNEDSAISTNSATHGESQPQAVHADGSLSPEEQRWMQFLTDHGYRTPHRVDTPIEECGAQPDFLYEGMPFSAAIYVDGNNPDRQARDMEQAACLEDEYGMLVLRFGDEDGWQALVASYTSLFA